MRCSLSLPPILQFVRGCASTILVAWTLGAFPATAATSEPQLGFGMLIGTVTDAVTSAPLSGVMVIAYNSGGAVVGAAATSTTGMYVIQIPMAGAVATVYARTAVVTGTPYLNELYDGILCLPGCAVTAGTPITLHLGSGTPDINFSLTPGGAITGTVTAAGSGVPLSGVSVQLTNSTGSGAGTVLSASDGSFAFIGPPTGTYYARTSVPDWANYLDELYDNLPCVPGCSPTSGTPIVVTAGTVTTGVNFSLALGGAIAGTITGSAGIPLQGVRVTIYSRGGMAIKDVWTFSDGTFLMSQLPTGTYYARTLVADDVSYFDELYSNQPCVPSCAVTTGTPIPLTAGATTSGINFNLSPSGAISGSVTAAGTGDPISDALVEVYSPTGALVRDVIPAPDGTYTVGGLPAGVYYVRTSVEGWGTPYLGEVYDNLPCVPGCLATTGTPVAVTAGTTTGGIHFSLSSGGRVAGRVTDAESGAPLGGVSVRITAVFGTTSGIWSAVTASDGTYVVVGLPPRSHFVKALPPSSGPLEHYLPQVFNDVVCFPTCAPTAGTPVSVTAGATTAGIDFHLTSGTGSIGGTVTDAVSGAPLNDVLVMVYTGTGLVAGSRPTSPDGTFIVIGLPPGAYYVRTNTRSSSPSAQYLDELYNNVPCEPDCTLERGTLVLVEAGGTPHVQIGLTRGGTITGTITDALDGTPLRVEVRAYAADGVLVKSAAGSNPGAYSVAGLPAGSYFVRTFSGAAAAAWAYMDELFDDHPCAACQVTTGTPVPVTTGTTTGGVDFALAPGGSIRGTVTDAASGAPLTGIRVDVYTSNGTWTEYATSASNGTFAVTSLPTGTYFARTINSAGYVDELWDNIPCVPRCEDRITTGSPIPVAAGGATIGVNFTLVPGGRISGRVSDEATGAGLNGARVDVYTWDGARATTAVADADGAYLTLTGLPGGIYYARTVNGLGYLDEVFNNHLFCFPNCLVTAGTPIVVFQGVTAAGADFALTSAGELINNGDFVEGLEHWGLFATREGSIADLSYLAWQVSTAFRYYRVPPPPQKTNQAVILQATGTPLPAGVAIIAQFDLANSSNVRKRIGVLIHDADFSDLSVCTFWLAPHTAPTRYAMRTHNTKAWTNATISFYAATAGSDGGYYELDDVSLQAVPSAAGETRCVDPTAPVAPGGPDEPNLIVNGEFNSGTIAPWGLFGQIVSRLADGVFEFYRPPPPDPAGVILQPTGMAVPAGQIVTARFHLGNSSPVRKRVTVLLHDLNFTDLTACTFWLAPGQPLLPYWMRSFATQPWTNATLSVYASTIGLEAWTQLDNVMLQRTPGATPIGTDCVEPGGGAGIGTDRPQASTVPSPTGTPPETGAATPEPWRMEAHATGTQTLEWKRPLDLRAATDASLGFQSWLSFGGSSAEVQVSTDGVTWQSIATVPASAAWIGLDIDLGAFAGHVIYVRLVFTAVAPEEGASPDVWRIRDVLWVVRKPTQLSSFVP
jgi:hypothetical protein